MLVFLLAFGCFWLISAQLLTEEGGAAQGASSMRPGKSLKEVSAITVVPGGRRP